MVTCYGIRQKRRHSITISRPDWNWGSVHRPECGRIDRSYFPTWENKEYRNGLFRGYGTDWGRGRKRHRCIAVTVGALEMAILLLVSNNGWE